MLVIRDKGNVTGPSKAIFFRSIIRNMPDTRYARSWQIRGIASFIPCAPTYQNPLRDYF